MKNKFTFIILFWVICINASCSQPKSDFEPANPKGLVAHKFVIGGNGFEVLLPKGYSLDSTSEDKVIFTIPDTRNVHYLSIGAYSKKSDFQEWERTIFLKAGNMFQFSTKQNIGAGSGGIEEELVGTVRLDQAVLNIECRDQSEWHPKPEWCVPYLHHLRFKGW